MDESPSLQSQGKPGSLLSIVFQQEMECETWKPCESTGNQPCKWEAMVYSFSEETHHCRISVIWAPPRNILVVLRPCSHLSSWPQVGLHRDTDLPFSRGSWKTVNLEATNFLRPNEHLGNFLAFPKGCDLSSPPARGPPVAPSQPLLPTLLEMAETNGLTCFPY